MRCVVDVLHGRCIATTVGLHHYPIDHFVLVLMTLVAVAVAVVAMILVHAKSLVIFAGLGSHHTKRTSDQRGMDINIVSGKLCTRRGQIIGRDGLYCWGRLCQKNFFFFFFQTRLVMCGRMHSKVRLLYIMWWTTRRLVWFLLFGSFLCVQPGVDVAVGSLAQRNRRLRVDGLDVCLLFVVVLSEDTSHRHPQG